MRCSLVKVTLCLAWKLPRVWCLPACLPVCCCPRLESRFSYNRNHPNEGSDNPGSQWETLGGKGLVLPDSIPGPNWHRHLGRAAGQPRANVTLKINPGRTRLKITLGMCEQLITTAAPCQGCGE